MIDELLPRNEAFERLTVGVFLVYAEARRVARDLGLAPEIYFNRELGLIYRTISKIEKLGEPFSFEVVLDHLRRSGHKNVLEVDVFMRRLAQDHGVTAEGIGHYIKELQQLYADRQSILLGQQLTEAGSSEERRILLRDGTARALSLYQGYSQPEQFLIKAADLAAAAHEAIPWLVDRVVPQGAVTLLPAPGGSGKSWVVLFLAEAVAAGQPFLGRPTLKRPVVIIDLENPRAVACRRLQKIRAEKLMVWPAWSEHRPPRLDGPDWELYLQLPEGSMVVIDSLRASCPDSEENDSGAMGLVMARLRAMRDVGLTVLVVHHSKKADHGTYRGSSVILDGCDHVLNLRRRQENGGADIAHFTLETGIKSRYDFTKLSFSIDFGEGTIQAEQDRDSACLDLLEGIIASLRDLRTAWPVQGDIVAAAKDQAGWSERETRKFLSYGTGVRWHKTDGSRGSKIYSLISADPDRGDPDSLTPLGGVQASRSLGASAVQCQGQTREDS